MALSWLPMRCLQLALGLLLSAPARAEEPPSGWGQPGTTWGHPASWYGGWTLIAVGGVGTLTGAALTTQSSDTVSISGWVTLSVSTAAWIAGALLLRFAERRTPHLPGALPAAQLRGRYWIVGDGHP
jgi:hypothetical protein